jgi:ABC-type bacteriocin/lantibiotic exporter with double-glycine peptidase domain
MLEAVKKLFLLLSPRERRRFYAVVLLAIVSGLCEMLGVASVLPFLAVLSDPSQIERNAALHRVYVELGFASPHGFMIFLGFAVLALILTSLGVRLVSIFAISRFSNMRAYSLSSQLIESYLRQPYPWFLGRNSAQLSRTVLIEVQRVVNGAIMPVMTTISQAALVLSLLGLLLVMEPVIALTAVVLFGGSYVLVYLVTRRVLARIGEVIIQSNDARFKSVHEVMTSIKDVKILGVERPFLERFCEPTRRMAVVQAQGAVISEAPRYLLEAMALGAMLVLILYL